MWRSHIGVLLLLPFAVLQAPVKSNRSGAGFAINVAEPVILSAYDLQVPLGS